MRPCLQAPTRVPTSVLGAVAWRAMADSLYAVLVESWLDWLRIERGLSPNTVAAYRRDVRRYTEALDDRGVAPADIASDDVSAHIARLGRDGLAATSVARTVASIRSFHAYCCDEGFLDGDPTALVSTPKLPQPVPKALDVDEVIRLLDAVAGDTPVALRDRCLLELLYGTGMRVSEAVGLDVADIDLERDLVRCFGKGAKERVVPLGSFAHAAVEQWLVRGRPMLRHDGRSRVDDALVLNARGTARLTRQGAWLVLKRRADQVGLGPKVSPHVLRHSCATHMLEGGADIRLVQEFLGHASIGTTQVYTRVSRHHLHEVFVSSHPRALMQPRPNAASSGRGDDHKVS